MVMVANPIGTATFALIAGCDRGSKGSGTDGAKGDSYLLQPSGRALEDEGPPPVGVPGHDGPYN